MSGGSKINRILILLKVPLCECENYVWAIQDGPHGMPRLVVWCQTCKAQTNLSYHDFKANIMNEPIPSSEDILDTALTEEVVADLLRKTRLN